MKKLVLSALAVLVTAFALVAVPAAASAAPLKVAVAASDGSTKVKVAKKLKILVVCSNDCIAKVKIKLITPVVSDSVKGGKALKAQELWGTGMILSGVGKNILKKNFRNSRLVVTVNARDRATGKHTIKHKTLTFKK